MLLPFVHERYPLVPFFPGDAGASEAPYEMCAMPTVAALTQMLQSVGFSEVETVYTPSLRYWKKFLALVTNRPQSGRGIRSRARVVLNGRQGDRRNEDCGARHGNDGRADGGET